MIYRNNIFLSVSFIGLISLGLVMVTSSSIYIADNLTGNPFYFATRQALFIGIGILVFTIFISLPSSFLEKTDWLFLLISILLLVALLIHWFQVVRVMGHSLDPRLGLIDPMSC